MHNFGYIFSVNNFRPLNLLILILCEISFHKNSNIMRNFFP